MNKLNTINNTTKTMNTICKFADKMNKLQRKTKKNFQSKEKRTVRKHEITIECANKIRRIKNYLSKKNIL